MCVEHKIFLLAAFNSQESTSRLSGLGEGDFCRQKPSLR